MNLTVPEFEQVVKSAPLVAVDFIVKNNHNEVLLGMRHNPPAKGFWFTPGGRCYKNELHSDAMSRIFLSELGGDIKKVNPVFVGVYDHLYEDNFLGNNSFCTHYVILAYTVSVSTLHIASLPTTQHGHYKWFSVDEIVSNPTIHKNVQNYFRE